MQVEVGVFVMAVRFETDCCGVGGNILMLSASSDRNRMTKSAVVFTCNGVQVRTAGQFCGQISGPCLVIKCRLCSFQNLTETCVHITGSALFISVSKPKNSEVKHIRDYPTGM